MFVFTGIGTVINVVAIVIGGLIGLVARRGIKERYKETILAAIATCVMFIGFAGALKEMIVIEGNHIAMQGTLMLIGSFVIGTLIGEILDFDGALERFGEWLKIKTKNEGDSRFIDGFLIASFTVCIGAMAIVGAIQDALTHDYSTLAAKSVLDFIFVMIMTASLGKGCIYSAIPVGILQGAVTLLAGVIAPFLTTVAISNISFTGSLMIFLVGVNIMFDKRIRIANMLPTLVVAALWASFVN